MARNTDLPTMQITTMPEVIMDYAARINEAVAAAEHHARGAVQSAIEAGQLLAQAKQRIPRGQWEAWLTANCTVAPRTARAYMQLAARHDSLSDADRQRVAVLPVREAIRAIATTTDAPLRRLPRALTPDRARSAAETFAAGATALRITAQSMERHSTITARQMQSLRSMLCAMQEVLDVLAAEGTAA